MTDQTTKACTTCKETKPLEQFPKYGRNDFRRRHRCKACDNVRVEAWHQAHKEERLAKARARYYENPAAVWTPERRKRANELSNIRHAKLRAEVYARHGGECVACGQDEPLFLTLDHINNDGWSQRREDPYRQTGAGLYKKILRDGMPADIEILCYNCNFGKIRNGGVLVKDRRKKGKFNDQSESS